MSNPIEDFIISLGFDTSKVKSQVQTLHKELEKLAVTVDAKRVKQGLTVAKEVGNNEVKVTKEVAKKKEDVEKKSAKKQAEIKEKVQTASEKKRIEAEKQTQKTITETRKQAALRQLRNQIAEYERSTVGPSNLSNRYKYYERGNASLTKIRAFTEEIRGKNTDTRNRMKAEGSLKSFDSAASSKAEMDMLKASNALEVLRTRMSKMGMQTTNLDKQLVDAKDLNSMKRLIEQTKHQINLEKELNKGRQKVTKVTQEADAHVLAFQKQQARIAKKQAAEAERELKRQQKLAALKPKESNINALMQRYRTNNLMQRGGEDAIMAGAMKQATQKQAEAYVKASLRAMEYSNKGIGNKKDTMRIISEGNVQVLSKANMQLAAMNAKMVAVERRAISAAAAFNGMHDSARNMVREMASVYAVMAATGAIKEQAKAMDGMQAGMVAVSSNAEEAAHNIKFLTDEALKNGLSIKDASKDYVKLKASIGDKLGLAETEEMFQALTKAGVVFQLSQDDMSGTIRAVSQMYSKGKITAEEFRQQLGDRIPLAMRALEKSTGKTSGELEKMMEQGQLTAEYIKPLVMAMGELAEANGAYEKALLKLGTVENRLKTTAGLSAAKIAEAGFTKGLINLYETLMDSMNENGATLTRIGKIYEKVFNGIANVVQVVTKWVEVFVRTLDTMWQVMQWGVDNPIKTITAGLVTLTGMIMAFPKLMGAVGSAIMAVLRGPLAVITAVMGAIDEVRSIFDENLIGIGENDKASAEDRKIAAANARVAMSMGTKEDEALLKGLSKDRIKQAQIASGGPAQYLPIQSGADSLSLTNNPITNFSEKVGLNIPQEGYFSPANGNVILGSLIGFAKTSADYTKSAMMDLLNMHSKQLIDLKSMGFNQTIIIQGNATDDSVQKIKDETRRVMEDFGSMNSAGVR